MNDKKRLNLTEITTRKIEEEGLSTFKRELKILTVIEDSIYRVWYDLIISIIFWSVANRKVRETRQKTSTNSEATVTKVKVKVKTTGTSVSSISTPI